MPTPRKPRQQKRVRLPAPNAAIGALEAYRVLAAASESRFGAVPGELVAAQVIRVTEGADWPVQRAAHDALLRRYASATRDGLRVVARPRGRRVLGAYRTRGDGDEAPRPYRTALFRLDPLVGGCDCPDFLRSSLGLCKHLLVALDAAAGDAARWERTLERPPSPSPMLRWDPVRPLHGPGDWLERVHVDPGGETPPGGDAPLAAAPHSSAPLPASVVRSAFRPDAQGVWRVDPRHCASGDARLALCRRLLRALERDDADVRLGGVDPALVALARREVARRGALGKLAGTPGRGAAPPVSGLALPLYPYQRAAVARFLAEGRLLLADDMGLGKTAQATAIAHALSTRRAVRRGLVLVPAALKGQWAREWRRFSDVPVAVVDGHADERQTLYRATRSGWLIANYELLIRDLDALLAWDPEAVLLDEAQRVKNWQTRTAACVKALRPRFRLALTGTPLENRLDELASIMDFVDDMALEPKWRLTPWHTYTVGDADQGAAGARNLHALRERLAPVMLRRTRAEVLGELPARTDTLVPVELTDAQRDVHAMYDRPIARLLRMARKRPLTREQFLRLMGLLTRQRIVSNGHALHAFEATWPELRGTRPTPRALAALASPKLEAFREIVSEIVLTQGRRVVVFSQWRRMLRLAHWAIGDLLDDAGHRAAFFTGAESTRVRDQSLVQFHDDPATRVLFLSDAGGVGLNLQRAASCCVMLETPWNPAVLEQRVARIHRHGQRDPIDVYSIATEDGIEARIARSVEDKRALFEGLFEGDGDEVAFGRGSKFFETISEWYGDEATDRPAGESSGAPEAPPSEVDDAADLDDAGLDAVAVDGAVLDGAGLEGADLDDAAAVDAAVLDGAHLDGPAPADEARAPRPASPGTVDSRVPSPAADPAALLARVRVERTGDGGLRLEAPPDAAHTLAALFDGMARLLREQSR